MIIDATQFPVVWMRMNAPSKDPDASPFAEFEALLERKKVFVLLNAEGLGRNEHEHSPQEMKQTSLWMKRHKTELRAFAKAIICIEANAAKRLAAKAFAVLYKKFWGHPMLMASSKDEALSLAQTLLLNEDAERLAL